MKKEVIVTIDHLTNDGVGVAKIEKKPLYVKNCFPLEKLKVCIDFEGKRNIYGHIQHCIEANPNRVQPICSVYEQCGGCQLSFMNYQAQLQFKQSIVKRIFQDAGFDQIMVHSCIGMENPYAYRNKVQTPIQLKNKKIVAGFYKENTHDLIAFDYCHVQSKESNFIIQSVILAMEENKIPPYNEDKQTGVIRHLLIRQSKKEWMLVLVTAMDSFPGRNNFIQSIKKRIPYLTTIVQNINSRSTSIVLGEKERVLYGPGFINDELLDLKFQITSKSFYQVNPSQTVILYQTVEKLAKLEEKQIPEDIDYQKVTNLASEARQKLEKIRPKTLAQASRISGVNPVDISVLTIYLKKEYGKNDN